MTKYPSQALGDWDAATKSRALYVANWEGDAILEYGVGLDDSVAFRGVFASDPRLRHPEGMVFWKGALRVCASYHSTIVALGPDGRARSWWSLLCVQQPWVTVLAIIARVFGCAACDGRALALGRWGRVSVAW